MQIARMIQVVFEGSFQEQLYNLFKPRFSNSTLNSEQFLHHVTVFFARKPVDVETDKWGSVVNEWATDGEEVFVYLNELVWSDTFGVEALVVTLKNTQGVVLETPPNTTWHITVSTESKPPKESMTLLNNRSDPSMRAETKRLNGIKLMGRIKHYK